MLRYLRGLVTFLAVVMALGMITIAAILWLRLAAPVALPELPANIQLPADSSIAALTFAQDWIIVVTQAGEVLLYDREGVLRDRLQP